MLENTSLVQIHLFYPLLFIFLIVVVVTIGLVIKGKSSDKKDTTIFAKSSDNAKEITIDTTSKMAQMHDNVVKVDFTNSHEKELDEIEQTIDTHTTQLEQLTAKVEEINIKLDEVLTQMIELKKKNKI